MKTIYATMVLVLMATAVCGAQNVSGTITCDGHGVAGVPVSDGYMVVLTDADGHYEFRSAKKNGYVFYTLPGGYEPMVADGFMPLFWAPLDSADVSVNEVHDFTLRQVDNDRHTVIFAADPQVARRNSDRAFLKKGFIASLNEEVERTNDIPIYSVILGDLTWDVFWYMNDYDLTHFVADMKHFNYPMILWPVIGNHDHDPSTMPWDNTDWNSARLWRSLLGPNYYSFNLGKVHYIVLDDIQYLNEPKTGEEYPEGVMGSRNYRAIITAEQLSWLNKDLELIDSSTPIVLCMHIPAWGINSSFEYNQRLYNTMDLCNKFRRFENVHIMSGHNHTNFNAHPESFPNIFEHNITAASGSLWYPGYLTGHHIAQDGSPAAYLRWTADGDDLRWYFKPIHEGESQMRIYDMNTVRDFYRTNNTMRAILNEYPDRVNYAALDSNVVMVNVFDYDINWKVEICEGDSLLECTRFCTEDPFHTLAYDVAQYSVAGYYSTSYTTTPSMHLFDACAATSTLPITVRVIDGFGNIYLKRIERPHAYNLDMDKKEQDLIVGDVNMDQEVNIADVNLVIDAIIGQGKPSCPSIMADCNGDDEINLADINTIISSIISK